MDGTRESAAATAGNSLPPFLSKTYDMVDDPSTDAVVSWSESCNSFVVWSVPEFSRDLLPKHFKHNNFSSFVRQLNTYGFRKVDPDRWEFANEGFLKGQKSLLKTISRRKPVHVHNQQPPPTQEQPKSVGLCVEVGKVGLEKAVDRLRQDKNILMQELVRLRQQQQSTDNQLQTVGKRVQVMEKRQQQMMSFLAKAMQSPSFLAQLVQQQNESNRRISGGSKKRRLPKHEEEEEDGSSRDRVPLSPNGQIIKYQPLINDAAKSMLRQILNIDASPRMDPLISNPNAFLIDDGRSSSLSQMSEVTFSEAAPASGQANLLAEPSFPANCEPTPPLAEVEFTQQLPGASAQDYEGTVFPKFAEAQEMMPESTVDIPRVMNFVGPEPADGSFPDLLTPGESDALSSDPDLGSMMDDDMRKLPSINDAFWEQFLSSSPVTGDTDESDSPLAMEDGFAREEGEGEVVHTGQGDGVDRTQCLDQLTEQMGILGSNSGRV